MNRRELLAAAAAVASTAGAAAQSRAAPAPVSGPAPSLAADGLRAVARDAYLYGLPWIEMAAARARMLGAPGAQLNQFSHARALAGPQSRAVTTPNNDTLYSMAWVDLTQGPARLTIPPTGARYISVAGMNMWTDNDFVLGTRTVGGGGGVFEIVGPNQTGSGPDIVRLATSHGWLLARTLVDGPDDLPATHAVQDGLKLVGAKPSAPLERYAPRSAPALEIFESLARLMRSDPPPGSDAAMLRRIAPLGLTGATALDPSRFTAEQRAELEAGVNDARTGLLMARGGAPVQGWTYPPRSMGLYGQDYLTRAAVALGGLAALPGVEAMYLNPVGDSGRMFTGPGPYRLTLPAGAMPPLDGFWSLTMYEATPDGQFFLVENPIRRYAIGDRTQGLRKNADGSLDIWIARSDPGGDRSANWLPAPAAGPFTMSFRAYLPRPAFLNGVYRLPPIVKA